MTCLTPTAITPLSVKLSTEIVDNNDFINDNSFWTASKMNVFNCSLEYKPVISNLLRTIYVDIAAVVRYVIALMIHYKWQAEDMCWSTVCERC